ncbi:MAG: trehalase family glycosidase, partial [Runella zeae]
MTLSEARNSGFMLMEDFQCLYEEIQQSGIFSDSKTFTDAIAKGTIAEILEAYHRQKQEPDFDLKSFVETFFVIPIAQTADYQSDSSKPLRLHLEDLWLILARSPAPPQGTLIALPYDYVVPGGRFREIYYWDSYFTMLGLEVSGQYALVESMVNNFAHLIDSIGFIPNGNRTYYLGRSQPPFFALMVQLLANHKGEEVWQQYLPQLEKEYGFWMKGREELSLQYDYLNAQARTVMLPDGSVLNRYWDDVPLPRPEAYKEDVALAQQIKNQTPEEVYRHVRAAAESGWDFSSRWFKDGQNMTTIHTTDIIPVDL